MTRQRIPASTWHERIAHWRSSGMTAQAYAHEHDIGLERLKYWARRVERASSAGPLLPDAVWLTVEPVDMRTGVEGLSLHVQQALGRAPCDGTAYVFSNRRRTRIKVVSWDGTGVWMCLRRLHRGQFIWPQPGERCWQLSAEQWQWLAMGVDWQRLSARAPAQWRL